jgi:hypothetical protein
MIEFDIDQTPPTKAHIDEVLSKLEKKKARHKIWITILFLALIFICFKFFSVINAAIADDVIVAFIIVVFIIVVVDTVAADAVIFSAVTGNAGGGGIGAVAVGSIKKINEKIKSLHPINSQACISLVEISKNRPKIKKYIDAVANMEPSRKLVQGELDMIVKYDESYDECNACEQIYSGNV